MKIFIKPLSVNKAWQGKRFKTSDYKEYEKELMLKLPIKQIQKDRRLCLKIKWGYSNAGSDIDNPIKPFTDILSKKYEFNDKQVYKLIVEKINTDKKTEFIDFNISYI